jgi:hypothetical protein
MPPPTARHPGETPTRSTVAHAADIGLDVDGQADALAELAPVDAAVAGLAAALAVWSARRLDQPDATARCAANAAVDAIDAALAGLHAIRSALVGQIRQADDAAAERVDALLARPRG